MKDKRKVSRKYLGKRKREEQKERSENKITFLFLLLLTEELEDEQRETNFLIT